MVCFVKYMEYMGKIKNGKNKKKNTHNNQNTKTLNMGRKEALLVQMIVDWKSELAPFCRSVAIEA